MQLTRLLTGVAALVGLVLAAGALFVGAQSLLVAAGVPEWVAYPTAVGAVLPPVLAFADAYTPFGNTARTSALRALPAGGLAADGALAAGVGGVVGYAGGALFLSPGASSLAELVVVATAVVVGYVTFIARNIEVYGDRQTEGVDAGEFRP